MCWYYWKVWRFAWGANRCESVQDGSGNWRRLFSRLFFRVDAVPIAPPDYAGSYYAGEEWTARED